MTDSNMYIPQSDGIEVEEIETIEYNQYPATWALDFDRVTMSNYGDYAIDPYKDS